MIKIQKESMPLSLKNNAQNWTTALLKEDVSKPVPKKYRTYYAKKDIKETLAKEAHGKCAYCERRILANQHGDIEHIQPVSVERARMFEWTNLVLACQLCNQKKSNKTHSKISIIHPVLDLPTSDLIFEGVSIHSDTAKGLYTIEAVGLNRAGLLEERHRKITVLRSLIDQYKKAVNPEAQSALVYVLKKETYQDSEFSAAISGYLSRECPEIMVDASA